MPIPVVLHMPYAQQVGAGISLAPNGMRVLDSLGLAHMIQDEIGEAIHVTDVRRPDGAPIVRFSTATSFEEVSLGLSGPALIAGAPCKE